MDLLTAGVMKGMIGASSYMKMADVSMGVYRQAQGRGDEATMERAWGYTADSMSGAKVDSEKAQEALEEAQMKAKELAKAEQQADLDKKAQESAQVRKAERQAAVGGKTQETAKTQQQAAGNPAPVDTVEISNEGKSAAQGNVKASTGQDVDSQINIDIPERPVNTSLPEAKIYTPKGDIKPANIKAKLSVSV